MINREQLNLIQNKARRTTSKANNNLDNICVPRKSIVTNITTKFTGLENLIHVQPGHEASCFNRD